LKEKLAQSVQHYSEAQVVLKKQVDRRKHVDYDVVSGCRSCAKRAGSYATVAFSTKGLPKSVSVHN
jgi:hypothetical protein